jgi:uracil phosphoribosyltransferase
MNSTTLRDHQFKNVSFQLSEMKHHYGSQLHLLSDPYLLSLLAKLCSSETTQPVINELIHSIYTSLLNTVIAKEFPTSLTRVPTRMNTYHPQEAYYEGPVINSEIPVVCVNLARAGTYPSHLCYTQMNYLMNPAKVRQDHISIARRTNQQDQVTGSHVSGHKIGEEWRG